MGENTRRWKVVSYMVIIAAMFFAIGAISYRSYIIGKSSRFEYGAVPESVDPAAMSSYGTVVLPARYVNLGPARDGKFYIGTCSSTTDESKHCFAYESDDEMSVRLLKDFSDGRHTEVPIVFPASRGIYATLHPDPIELWRSADGGATWSMVFEHPTERSIYCLLETTGHLFFGTWPEGSIYRSEDGVNGWECVYESSENGFFSLLACPSNEDIILGGSFRLQRSVDGGRTWSVVPAEEIGPVRALLPGPGGTIAAVGDHGVLVSEDTGESWTLREMNLVRDHLCHFTVQHRGYIYIGGDNGVVLRSNDLGGTWQTFFEIPQPFDPGKRMYVRGVTAIGDHVFVGTSHYKFAGEPLGTLHRIPLSPGR